MIIYRIVSTDDMAFGKLSDLTSPLETVILTVVFMIIDIGVIIRKIKKKNCLTLVFPFKEGRFLVVDGGDGKKSCFTNYYYGWKNKGGK
ncbi:hypothetical protein [Tepidimicrobium xylanilyticum]|uniref:Uncharacterized protein n=1 Tax=Tepidimicrobium xylanilyticum TaxID=1123352 RepID=A0A1H2XEK7_9FIRM|nr:hypothetical protein [Tepidimicrobium xylanilyticum]GMG97474.1 hypothetical protein EN5CB1_23000 [Tepidimicrobium xylanilyticum]SDW91186.1 hypothetical protein SAMN05660923_01418 [Tepidimicrobium xylanilyticum]